MALPARILLGNARVRVKEYTYAPGAKREAYRTLTIELRS